MLEERQRRRVEHGVALGRGAGERTNLRCTHVSRSMRLLLCAAHAGQCDLDRNHGGHDGRVAYDLVAS